MKVSFLVPLYNCLPLTQAMLASLHATVPPGLAHEIILIDDGSTDGTRDWLQGLSRPNGPATLAPPPRVILNERNLGYAAANNRAAAFAQGEFIVLLNNDLVLTPHWLEPMLAAHRRLGARAGVIGNVQRNVRSGAVDHSGMTINLKAKPEHLTSLPPRWLRRLHPLRRVPAVTAACALVTRSLWRELGGFDEGFMNGGEDVDFSLRARAAGRVNAVALRSIVAHHVSASPNRKLRDEFNSHRLALRWRADLEHLAVRRWCWHYLDRHWTTPHPAVDYAAASAALGYGLHLRPTPPALAVAGMRATMDHELARWEQLLGTATGASSKPHTPTSPVTPSRQAEEAPGGR